MLDIDITGVQNFKKSKVDARYVFVVPPQPRFEVLRGRLQARGTEDPVAVQRRLDKAQGELTFLENNPTIFDLVLVNDDLEKAFEELKNWIDQEKSLDEK